MGGGKEAKRAVETRLRRKHNVARESMETGQKEEEMHGTRRVGRRRARGGREEGGVHVSANVEVETV